MSSSTPHASSGAAAGATATATADDRHLPQLKTLKEKPHHDPSPGSPTYSNRKWLDIINHKLIETLYTRGNNPYNCSVVMMA